jgi:hypothetical protein
VVCPLPLLQNFRIYQPSKVNAGPIISHLSQIKDLRELDLGHLTEVQSILSDLIEALANSHIRSFNFEGSLLDTKSAAVLFSNLHRFAMMNRLTATGRIGDQGAEALASSLPNTTIERLEIGSADTNLIGDSGLTALGKALPSCRSLRVFLVGRTSAKSQESLATFGSGLSASLVQTFSMNLCSFDCKASHKFLESLATSSTLQRLRLEHLRIDSTSLPALVLLITGLQQTLTRLELQSSCLLFSDDLFSAIKSSRISHLDIGNIAFNVNDAMVLSSFAKILPSTQLHTFILSTVDVASDESVLEFAQALESSKMLKVDLERVTLSAKGARCLVDALKKSNHLVHLRMSNHDLERSELSKLQSELQASKPTPFKLFEF